MKVVINDGGRAAVGYKGQAGDCVTRAIAIATGKPYQEVYDALWSGLTDYAATHRDRTAKRIGRGGGRTRDDTAQWCQPQGIQHLPSLTRLAVGADNAYWFRLYRTSTCR